LPPRWGLGFTQRVHRLYAAEEVKAEADEFASRGFPLDYIGLEPGWQSKSYPGTFEWDKTRFQDPEDFVMDMMERGVRLNLWINPYVAADASFARDIEPYTASHTVWVGMVPDFTLPAAREAFFNQLEKDQVAIGVSGYKIDEVDGFDQWLWPDVATFPSGLSGEQMRQTYGLLTQRYTTEMFEARNQRTYGLVRAANGGGVRCPYGRARKAGTRPASRPGVPPGSCDGPARTGPAGGCAGRSRRGGACGRPALALRTAPGPRTRRRSPAAGRGARRRWRRVLRG